MPDQLEFTYITTHDCRLHVAQAGPADGPLAILLHGFPEFWYGWRHQIQPLAEAGLRVWAPDQRGYNLSDKPIGVSAYDIRELVRDVIGLIDAAGKEKCFLVGHDWGAAVAWEVALQAPQRVDRLAILNVPHTDVMTRYLLGSLRQVLKSWYIFFFQLPRLPEWGLRRDGYAGMKRALTASSRPGTFSADDIDCYLQAWSQPGALTAMLNWYRAVFRQGLRGAKNRGFVPARRVSVSTLMLWGKQDVALSWQMVQPSCDLCDQGRLVAFPNASHWVQHDEAEAVTRYLLDFYYN
jgi:pimeloyl-ACP methyl ester carboxylesterase